MSFAEEEWAADNGEMSLNLAIKYDGHLYVDTQSCITFPERIRS